MKKNFYRHYLLMASLLSTSILSASNATPYFSIRSQSVDSARKLAGWADKINIYLEDECENYFVGSVAYEYTRSFRSDQLARCLFGASCLEGCSCPTIKISGSGVASRGEQDWLADYFYLPTDYQSLVSLRPRIENHIIDFNLYWGWEECCEGLYFWVQLPAVHTKWNLNYCEEIIDSGSASYVPGYFASQSLDRSRMVASFSDYVSKESSLNIVNLSNTSEALSPIEAQPLKYAKWADCATRLNQTRLSDIHLTLGWNMWQCENYHFGLNFKVAIPTGNRPTGEYFFEPIVGNGHHWEVGGGISFHDIFWRGCDDTAWAGFFLEAAITHLFRDKQFRVFDLNTSCNSRYMLALQLAQPQSPSTRIGPDSDSAVNAFAQFNGIVAPVANLTHALVNVSYDVQADITAMFSSGWCNWTWDLGYNAWVRSCEKLTFDSCSKCIEKPLLNNQTWVLKGDAQVVGYEQTGADDLPVFLQVSQSTATIHTGANIPASLANPTFESIQNPGVNAAQFTFETGSTNNITATQGGTDNMLSSAEPVFLSYENVNVKGARTRGVSHKVFTHFNYNWEMDECGYAPYLGAGAMVEWGKTSRDKGICDPLCNESTKCKHCALSQWGVWVKGGFSYN
jgi:hypothetical protein